MSKNIKVIRFDVERGVAEFESYVRVRESQDEETGKTRVYAYIPIPKELITLMDLADGLKVKVRIELLK